MPKLKAPFPYFGGKSAVADIVWGALGDVKHYIEPFFGSGAVLLSRQDYQQNKHIETICDKDGFLANVWRSLQFAPDEVARWCDWPVNHADLSSRKRQLLANEARLLENLVSNDTWYDAQLAGYWIWAASCWIGSGLTCLGQIPNIDRGGKGVPAIGKRPHIGSTGVHALGQRPNTMEGPSGLRDPYNTNIYGWFRELSERLRYVRVVCGDWSRVCGGGWQTNVGLCGMFFDPPYSLEADRHNDLYHAESQTVAHDVREWCIRRGSEPKMRIVLAGYVGEHEELQAHGWTSFQWKAHGGYGNTARKGPSRGARNKAKEILWFSPNCLVGKPPEISENTKIQKTFLNTQE